MTDRFLLDTCAIIWIAQGAALGHEASLVLARVGQGRGKLYVSTMSGWEVGMLISKGRLATTRSAQAWFDAVVDALAAEPVETSLSILLASSFLPQPIHNDPTDRILIATAREHDLTIITRDRAILAYGAVGHVKTLAC
jgi:PIN domain nuclease of toxin-antitoxin system